MESKGPWCVKVLSMLTLTPRMTLASRLVCWQSVNGRRKFKARRAVYKTLAGAQRKANMYGQGNAEVITLAQAIVEFGDE